MSNVPKSAYFLPQMWTQLFHQGAWFSLVITRLRLQSGCSKCCYWVGFLFSIIHGLKRSLSPTPIRQANQVSKKTTCPQRTQPLLKDLPARGFTSHSWTFGIFPGNVELISTENWSWECYIYSFKFHNHSQYDRWDKQSQGVKPFTHSCSQQNQESKTRFLWLKRPKSFQQWGLKFFK